MHAHRDLVAHRAGRQEERGVLPEELRDHRLERVDGRILALLLVPDLRLAHEPAHLLRGFRDGVALEVDVDRGHAASPILSFGVGVS